MSFPEPYDWEQLLGGKNGRSVWPDRLLFKLDATGSKSTCYFIYDKGNNRGVTPEKSNFIRVLEACGINVFLNIAGNLMSLDEFNSGGGYQVKAGTTTRPYFYHLQQEVRQLEAQLKLPQSEESKQLLEAQLQLKRGSVEVLTKQFGKPQPVEKPTETPFGLRMLRIKKFLAENLGKPEPEVQRLLTEALKMKDEGVNPDEIEKQITDPKFVIGRGVLTDDQIFTEKLLEIEQNTLKEGIAQQNEEANKRQAG